MVAAQIDEFRRLYGADPSPAGDGHHHMHLCANVLYQGLLPQGTVVRRNFSFQPGEKSIFNRTYRRVVDGRLARRHRLVEFCSHWRRSSRRVACSGSSRSPASM